MKGSSGADAFVAGGNEAFLAWDWYALALIWGKFITNHAFETLESVLAGFAVVKGTLLTKRHGSNEKSFIADPAEFIIGLITKRTIINHAGRITAIFLIIDVFAI